MESACTGPISLGKAAGNSPAANSPNGRLKRWRIIDLLDRMHAILARVSIIAD